MPRAPAATRRHILHRPNKRVKLSHRRGRSSGSILGSISNHIGSTIAGLAGRLFPPAGPENDQFDPEPLGIHTPPEQPRFEVPLPSPMSLLSVMADEHAAFWDQLESTPDKSYIVQPCWIGIQTQTQGYDIRINPRLAHESQSFLDMDDSEEDSMHPTTGHSAFSDYDSDEDTDDDDLLTDAQSSPSTDSSSLPSPSACPASAGHSSWDDEPQSGDEYWDRQNATLCAKHIRADFPDAVSRGKLPLEPFIANVLRSTRGSMRDDVAFVALQFLKRVAPSCPLGYYEDMFFASLILADKMESDCSHSLRWWSRHCCDLWTVNELRIMERRMLQTLDWDLSTSINCRSSYQSFLVNLASFVPAI
ncbi:hypothetical protein FS749_003303 [Ceratobasidium sp. UAMH 11750]|nr:hypothetical protein FS749_003303 [Ceratobasidium sp. UAMH 11750]